MSLVRTSLRNAHGPTGTASRGRKAHRAPGRCRTALPERFPYVRPSAAIRQLGRRVLWDSLPVLPAGGAQHQHSTEQLRQSAIWGSALANRAGDNTPGVTQVKRRVRRVCANEAPARPRSGSRAARAVPPSGRRRVQSAPPRTLHPRCRDPALDARGIEDPTGMYRDFGLYRFGGPGLRLVVDELSLS